jgi:hypothetical protein
MPTNSAATDQEPVAKMLRLILTGAEWRSLRVMAAEQDTSMQALVAATMQREIGKHRRTLASEKFLAKDNGKGRA